VLTIGLDVGGTKLLGVVADAAGRVIAERRTPFAGGPGDTLPELARMVADLRDETAGVAAVGVGVAGLVDLAGVLRFGPNLPGWDNVRVRDDLEAAAGLPVVADNDGNVAALGEARFGAARGYSEALLITLGTGIGGGLVHAGEVYRGGFGFAAEVGHFTVDPAGPPCTCGGRGHWEALASGTALGRMGREAAARGHAPGVLARAGTVDAVRGDHVGDAAQAGEPDGLALMSAYARLVAMGLGGLINILDPEIVVVAGGLVELGAVLLDPVRAELPGFVEAPAHRPVPAVVPAVLGEHAGAVGAAALARSLVSETPSRYRGPGVSPT
jgi:glucokinase